VSVLTGQGRCGVIRTGLFLLSAPGVRLGDTSCCVHHRVARIAQEAESMDAARGG
jgi:hypothetical protein